MEALALNEQLGNTVHLRRSADLEFLLGRYAYNTAVGAGDPCYRTAQSQPCSLYRIAKCVAVEGAMSARVRGFLLMLIKEVEMARAPARLIRGTATSANGKCIACVGCAFHRAPVPCTVLH